ncbi:hypothetical protein [Hyphococcus sp.]|uniref:hypothetical protein n=1 Tax=Hyphococcus sp. TaxID=2038636 RepID=UPI00208A3CF8|nr:MAG: hypothetical protein DHS20C04_14950 [Marinicaulis sp.]
MPSLALRLAADRDQAGETQSGVDADETDEDDFDDAHDALLFPFSRSLTTADEEKVSECRETGCDEDHSPVRIA